MPRPVRNAPIARQADWGEPRFGLRPRGLVPVRSAESFRPGLRAPRLEAQAGRRPPFPVAHSPVQRTRARPNTNSPTEAPYDRLRTNPRIFCIRTARAESATFGVGPLCSGGSVQ